MIQAADEGRVAPHGVGKYLAQIAMVFAVQFAAGKLAEVLPIINSGGVGPVWPASGIALAALLLFGYQVWPGVAAAAFLLTLLSPIPPVAAVVYGIGSTLAALSGAFLLRRVVNFDPSLSRLRDALGLIVLGAFGSSVVSASIGVSVLYAVHLRGWSGFGRAWLIYWLGDSMGVLLVTPLVLTVPSLLRTRPRVRIAEFAALLLLLMAACFIVFGDLPLIPVKLHVLAFAVLPFVMWAAIRFGVSGATLSTLFVATIATAETAFGSGPFAQNTPFTNAVLLDVFFALLSVSGMTLAAVIAEREQAEREREQLVREQAAMEARLRLATIVESSDDAIIGKDIDGMITDWNRGAERLYGYSAGEVIGKPISLLAPPDRSSDFAEIMAALRRGNSLKHYETVRQKKDGTRMEVSLTMSPIRDTEGRVLGASVIGRDISERKRQEAILRESEERLRVAAEVGRMYAWEWDPATDSVLRSAECAGILGLSDAAREGIAKDYLSFIHPDDRAGLWSLVHSLTPEDPVYRTQYRRFRPDGAQLWLEESGCATFDGDGKMVRLVGMTADITERKLAQEELRKSEERLRLAVQAGKMFAYEWDASTDVIVRSAESAKILGIDEATQITGQQALAKVHPDDRERLMAAVAGLSPAMPWLEISYRMIRPDGTLIWVERNSRAHFDQQGKMLRIVGIVADITGRKGAELALRESEERFRLVANTAPVMIWMSGADKLCSYFNTPWLTFTGRPMASELGNGWAEGVHPDDFTMCMDTYLRAFDLRQQFTREYRLRRHDEEYRWLLDIGVPRFNADHSFAGYIGSCLDVTERKLAEDALAGVSRKLIEAQEQERSRIARELHDDINQRLALVAIGLEQVAQLEQSHSMPGAELNNRIHELVENISEIGSEVQAISHRLHSSKLEYLGIVSAVKSFCKEFGEQQKVDIAFSHDDIPRTVPQETSLCLFRVLQEALQNAVKHSDVRHFDVALRATPDAIQLTVSDSGSGFDLEEGMKASGLGLISMVERLKLVDGQLSIDSQRGRGTRIHARVPLSSESNSMRAVG